MAYYSRKHARDEEHKEIVLQKGLIPAEPKDTGGGILRLGAFTVM